MNLAVGTLALAAALAPSPQAPIESAGEELEYALPDLDLPCLGAPCGAVELVDFGFAWSNPGGVEEGAARLLVDDRLYLGLSASDLRQGVLLSGARWDLELANNADRTSVAAEYRWRRARLGARVEDHDAGGGDGRRATLEGALRLGPDLELILGALDDDRTRFLDGPAIRATSELSLGALWQRGEKLEVSGRLASATVETPAGIELDRFGVDLGALYQARRWRFDGDLSAVDLSGRFERREATARLGFAYRIFSHLVATAGVRERHETDLGSIERDLGAAVTYYGRRFRFARGGRAAARTTALARRAWDLGLNERRAHDLEGRRRLRERLSLAASGGELRSLAEDLHAAQIEERNVALGGVKWRREVDNLDGSELRACAVFVAVPWPRRAGPAIRHDERATDFLRLTYELVERDVSSGFSTEGTTLAMDLSLNRELALRLAWEDPAATGEEFALEAKGLGQLKIALAYRRGI